jgi:hypothetical protein
MTSIESRIYSDAASAAAEITPADVPPLRLHAARSRSSRRRGGSAGRPAFSGAARPASIRRWLAPLAAAAGVAVIIATMTAIRGGNGPAHHGRGHGTSPLTHPLNGAQAARAALAAEALDNYFPATGAQYTAGLAFEWTKFKVSARIFGSCMAEAGFPQPPFSEPESSFLQSFPDNSQYPDLAQLSRTDSMTGMFYIATKPTPPHTQAGRRAEHRCTAASDDPFPFAAIDRVASPLDNQWLNIVTTIQASARVHAMQPAFASCLEANGIPASYAQQQRPTASNPLFIGFFAWMDTLGQTSTSTRQLTAEEHRWTPVFVRCARPTVALMERLQLAQRASFFARHARQIDEIKKLATEVPTAGH